METHMVGLNIELLRTWLEDECDGIDGRLANFMGVSPGTVTNIMSHNRLISWKKAQEVAANTGTPIDKLVTRDQTVDIPDDVEYFTELRFGWYIDNDRRALGPGGASWFWETLRLHHVPGGGPMTFQGTLKNWTGAEYDVKVQRLSPCYVTFSARGEAERTEHEFFDATFMSCHEGVLCGVWTGIDHVFRPAAYRMFLSRERIDLHQRLTEVQRAAESNKKKSSTEKEEEKLVEEACEPLNQWSKSAKMEVALRSTRIGPDRPIPKRAHSIRRSAQSR